ncbi:radical SAM protein [Sandaracinus amylolyticus]|uniref:Radical SAM domain heme biosynthesis protein n=1 Tax=Sandaracinus amylolyticus TaxID=927083 RepID=A0A0F6VZ85_9BACT|nr:radical SAM protein [Sandaracinus amylolyticus]AKF03233.1 Radical SAM domain heme biosynthesis protein [Sandaracinus amylolyticus]
MASKIAVLDLRARSDVFLGDRGLSRIAERLERAGHEVARLDATWPADAAQRGAFLESLARDVGGRALDALVVERAWDAETLDVLRGALGGGKLVRLAGGVRAALDDRFDAVVDENGLRALLAGDVVPEPARPPSSAKEIRALRVLAHDEIEPEHAGALPAIRGPAVGCPYLVDAAKQAPFAKLALDREKVQTRGCTFCLDNTGAYAAVNGDETVTRWLAQLRTLRASRPDGRLEVLLVDERPHPHLPQLFRAVAAEGALGAIELLIKSRVDWLLEHEAELAEACTIAETSGSVVHVYLVGFESFDPDTLVLFNKGTSAEDNVRAIALLRDLAARFPRSFEHRRLRAHGFVAFTPWTTPEALLTNARRMREVGFDELRADAARTRLRLYPRTPLHALAEADGLLTPSFDATRGDRAAEQGYDASFAWRFADPRVEAIFAICEALRERWRTLPDADRLELATRFVLRWPGLASVPDVAHLPLVHVLDAWDLDPRTLSSTLGAAAIVDLELERLVAGHKRGLLKEGVAARDVDGLIRAYRATGLVAAVVETHDIDASGSKHLEGRSHAIVAVARTDDDLAEIVALQRARDTRAMGARMGYPTCCVEAFLAQPDRRDNVENERATLRRTGARAIDARVVRTGPVRLLSHHPCSGDCAASIAIAEQALQHLAAIDPRGARWARETLARPSLFLDHARSALLEGAWRGDRFEVRAIDDVPRRSLGVRHDDVVAIELARDRVVLIDARGDRTAIAASSPLLIVPGEPLALAARAVIAPSLPVALSTRPKWLELTPDYRCNQRCLGCGVMNEGGPSLSSRDLVSAMIDGRRQGIEQLWIGGGEPTLRRDLLPLVREARARGYTRVRLQTNAAMLAYPEVARRLADAGVTEIAVSIKGADALTHDRFARTEGAFELLCRGIEHARAVGLEVEGDVLVYRSTTPTIPDVVRVFSARGVARFRLWMMAPDASDPAALAEEPRIADVARAVHDALAHGEVVSLHTPPCALDDGDARARFFAPELGLLVHDATGRRFRLERSEIEGGAFAPRCDGCALRARCNGVRASYLSRHGEAELRPRRG